MRRWPSVRPNQASVLISFPGQATLAFGPAEPNKCFDQFSRPGDVGLWPDTPGTLRCLVRLKVRKRLCMAAAATRTKRYGTADAAARAAEEQPTIADSIQHTPVLNNESMAIGGDGGGERGGASTLRVAPASHVMQNCWAIQKSAGS